MNVNCFILLNKNNEILQVVINNIWKILNIVAQLKITWSQWNLSNNIINIFFWYAVHIFSNVIYNMYKRNTHHIKIIYENTADTLLSIIRDKYRNRWNILILRINLIILHIRTVYNIFKNKSTLNNDNYASYMLQNSNFSVFHKC